MCFELRVGRFGGVVAAERYEGSGVVSCAMWLVKVQKMLEHIERDGDGSMMMEGLEIQECAPYRTLEVESLQSSFHPKLAAEMPALGGRCEARSDGRTGTIRPVVPVAAVDLELDDILLEFNIRVFEDREQVERRTRRCVVWLWVVAGRALRARVCVHI
jgi:hypothetical protein